MSINRLQGRQHHIRSKYIRLFLALLLVVSCSFASSLLAAAHHGFKRGTPLIMRPPQYTFTVLKYPGKPQTYAYAINDRGQVLCSAAFRPSTKNLNGQVVYDDTVPQYGFLWQAGKTRAIGMTTPLCFNNDGQAVCQVADQNIARESYIWDNGHARNWTNGNRTDFSFTSTIYGMNDAVDIVGELDGYAYLWQEGLMSNNTSSATAIDLGTLGGDSSTAYGINARGQVVGEADSADGVSRAFLWQNGHMASLGELPDAEGGKAEAINDRDQAVGQCYVRSHSPDLEGAWHAVLFFQGKVTDLGVLPGDTDSDASAINAAGQAVGRSYHWIATATPSHAVLWEHGHMVDLDTLPGKPKGWTLWSAMGINRDGQIAVNASAGTQSRAFLLTPKR